MLVIPQSGLRACRLEQRCMQGLRYMRIPLERAFRLVGIPDFSRTVPKGCVVLVTEDSDLQGQEVRPHFTDCDCATDCEMVILQPGPPLMLQCMLFLPLAALPGRALQAGWPGISF